MALVFHAQLVEDVEDMMRGYHVQMAEAVNPLLKDGVELIKVANTHVNAWVVKYGDGDDDRTPMSGCPVEALKSAARKMSMVE